MSAVASASSLRLASGWGGGVGKTSGWYTTMAFAEAPKTFEDKVTRKKRLQDTEFAFPFCYGTIAFWLGKKADEYHSHKWTVYVRDPENKDLSHMIDRDYARRLTERRFGTRQQITEVVFKLHDSFEKPIRVVDTAPYELTETGWGEFEIQITIHFKEDVCEKPVELYHGLKLYEDQAAQERQSMKKPVILEKYDEAVFNEPYEDFYKRVVVEVDQRGAAPVTENTPHYPVYSDDEQLRKINAARRPVLQQIQYLQQQV